ncbi:hypothetical protein ['Camptotheca acuminata' phytoplasma]|uniref:hypothetical protein n=1 Tax='Camptotheca acuminata' phytoplasma TaxID=3239192 RepID=UPI00351AAEB9
MKIIEMSLFKKPKNISSNLTLAFGDFDGIHLGHQTILKKLLSYKDTQSALIQFIPNSKSFFKKQSENFLTSFEQKNLFIKIFI